MVYTIHVTAASANDYARYAEMIQTIITSFDQVGDVSQVNTNQTDSVLTRSYRCWQFNVDGYGGSCRTLSPIVFTADGTYSISGTTGIYNITDDIVTLSESTYWGAGTIKEAGLQIYFNYNYNGKQYEVTYLQE